MNEKDIFMPSEEYDFFQAALIYEVRKVKKQHKKRGVKFDQGVWGADLFEVSVGHFNGIMSPSQSRTPGPDLQEKIAKYFSMTLLDFKLHGKEIKFPRKPSATPSVDNLEKKPRQTAPLFPVWTQKDLAAMSREDILNSAVDYRHALAELTSSYAATIGQRITVLANERNRLSLTAEFGARITNSIDEVLFVVDSSGEVTFANKAAHESGFSVGAEFSAKEGLEKAKTLVKETFQSGVKGHLICQHGSRKFGVASYPIQDNTGKTGSVVVISRDITEDYHSEGNIEALVNMGWTPPAKDKHPKRRKEDK